VTKPGRDDVRLSGQNKVGLNRKLSGESKQRTALARRATPDDSQASRSICTQQRECTQQGREILCEREPTDPQHQWNAGIRPRQRYGLVGAVEEPRRDYGILAYKDARIRERPPDRRRDIVRHSDDQVRCRITGNAAPPPEDLAQPLPWHRLRNHAERMAAGTQDQRETVRPRHRGDRKFVDGGGTGEKHIGRFAFEVLTQGLPRSVEVDDAYVLGEQVAQIAIRFSNHQVDGAAGGDEAVDQFDDPALGTAPTSQRVEQDAYPLCTDQRRHQSSKSTMDGTAVIRQSWLLGRPGECDIVLSGFDMWRCAIVMRPATELSQADLVNDAVRWLPATRAFAFRADPFGLWHRGRLHIFVEAFDYRTLKGSIELLVCDDHLNVVHEATVLSKPWHLSYPFVFEADGEFWMLPEARRSGELTLYRARRFPDSWEADARIGIGSDAVDATPLWHDDRWWLFYATPTTATRGAWNLNLAFADRLTGPWRAHPMNPLRAGPVTRPAGTPLARPNGYVDLPLQDCSRTYGGSIRRLEIRRIDEARFDAEEFPWLEPSSILQPYSDGLHTLAAAGDVTLIDCKFVDRSLAANVVRQRGSLARRVRRWTS
jgi:hypothetical protein